MYQQLLSRNNPGLIMILIDQSGSMSDSYMPNQNKSQFTALAVNRVIEEIITACTDDETIKDRCHLAVIGYGTGANILFLEKPSALAKNTNTFSVKKKVSDGAGSFIEVDENIRAFVNATASGGTPMAEAFQTAFVGAEKFISNYPDSFPPIIINITDGEPNSIPDAIVEAKKIMGLKTSDGNAIIMNAHIADVKAGKIELPSNDTAFATNNFAQFLFEISSELPDVLAKKAQDAGFNVQSGSRGFIFNADAENLVKLLNFGSMGALR